MSCEHSVALGMAVLGDCGGIPTGEVRQQLKLSSPNIRRFRDIGIVGCPMLSVPVSRCCAWLFASLVVVGLDPPRRVLSGIFSGPCASHPQRELKKRHRRLNFAQQVFV